MAQKKIIVVCGEASGDLNAGNLVQRILELDPSLKVCGVGGAILRESGAEIIYDIKGLGVIGLFDVLKKLPRFFALRKLILKKIKEERPAGIIFVDFSGFNLRLAKRIDNSIPTIYYISPQVWASRKGRIKTIKRYIRKVIVIFKFEEEFYKKYGIDADFVGHPLLDIVRPTLNKETFLKQYGLSPSKATIALLPGSRQQEIKNILPLMLESSRIICEKSRETQFLVAKAPQVSYDLYRDIIAGLDIDLRVVDNKTYDCLNASDFSLVCSGTATLEAALLGVPFAVIYKMNFLNYLLYRPQIKIPYIGMVNIVAGERIVREFIQFQARPEKISEYALGVLNNPPEIKRMKDNLARIRSLLGEEGASQRAARIILDFLNKA